MEIDGQVARREDAELAKLMDQFVCVRVVQMWGVDLSLFQFHGQLTWGAFFLSADRAIYGRYGSRSSRGGSGFKGNDEDISLEGFKKALEGALELHAAYPANKAALAGKTGARPKWLRPELYPAAVKAKLSPAEATPAVRPIDVNCIHCHQVQDWDVTSLRRIGKPVPDRLLWTYPMPDQLGFSLDRRERATVSAVAPGSAAEKAGLKVGDKILALAGQPIISIADVQWVLQTADEPGTVKADVDRAGQKVPLSLAVRPAWRRGVSFADNLSLGWITRFHIAGLRSSALDREQKRKLGLGDTALALRIDEIAPDYAGEERNQSAQRIGLRKGDVLIELDGMKESLSESEFLAYLLQKKSPGQKLDVTFLRDGKAQKVALTLQ